MNVHELEGCAPTPLASYLKAIGVLRLVSEQVDAEARGFWRSERFLLASRLDSKELLDFFVTRYEPTPMLSPWNGGSGFYPGDNTTGLDALVNSDEPRFAPYRQAIADVRGLIGERESRPDKSEKASFVRRCRSEWSDQQLPWLNAALAVLGDDVAFPALLGTGGNDGRLDFTNNFMQRLAELLIEMDPVDRRALLESSLYDTAVTGMEKNAVGQFHPGGAGGMNAGPGFDAPSVVNSWDFVLLLEGALAIQVAAVRQLDSASLPVAAAPFAFRARAAGYGSATRSEESARGEQWFPLWERPMRYAELQAILREGRMQTSRGARATGAIDAAKALAAHGTSRGITAFQRYGYIERNGLSNLAVPLGRWEVRASPAVRLVDEIDGWLGSLRRASRDPAKDP
jgi:CRISPR-associated protein Csx17